jgi:hypothetical protein
MYNDYQFIMLTYAYRTRNYLMGREDIEDIYKRFIDFRYPYDFRDYDLELDNKLYNAAKRLDAIIDEGYSDNSNIKELPIEESLQGPNGELDPEKAKKFLDELVIKIRNSEDYVN